MSGAVRLLAIAGIGLAAWCLAAVVTAFLWYCWRRTAGKDWCVVRDE